MNFIACVRKWLNSSNTPLNELITTSNNTLSTNIIEITKRIMYKGNINKTKILSSDIEINNDNYNTNGYYPKVGKICGQFVAEYDGNVRFGCVISYADIHQDLVGIQIVKNNPLKNYISVNTEVSYPSEEKYIMQEFHLPDSNTSTTFQSGYIQVNKGDIITIVIGTKGVIWDGGAVGSYEGLRINVKQVWVGYDICKID